MPVSIFTETPTRARTFPTLLLVFVIPRSFTVFGEWARLSSSSVWHQQGSRCENEVLCQRRTRLLDCSISGALEASSGASADLPSRNSHGPWQIWLRDAKSHCLKPENGTQSTPLFLRLNNMISQGECPNHR